MLNQDSHKEAYNGLIQKSHFGMSNVDNRGRQGRESIIPLPLLIPGYSPNEALKWNYPVVTTFALTKADHFSPFAFGILVGGYCKNKLFCRHNPIVTLPPKMCGWCCLLMSRWVACLLFSPVLLGSFFPIQWLPRLRVFTSQIRWIKLFYFGVLSGTCDTYFSCQNVHCLLVNVGMLPDRILPQAIAKIM